MKINPTIYLLVIALINLSLLACNRKINQQEFVKESYEVELNDSMIKRVIFTSSGKLESIEYEDIKNDSIKVLFFDSDENLTESVSFNTVNQDYYLNRVFSNGRISATILKNDSKDELYRIQFENGKPIKYYYYIEGEDWINSMIVYDSQGKPDFRHLNSYFLKLKKVNDELLITPIGLSRDNYSEIRVAILNNYDHNEDLISNMNIDKMYRFKSLSDISIDLKNYQDKSVWIKCEFEWNDEGVKAIEKYYLFIENTENIPANNLYPIFK